MAMQRALQTSPMPSSHYGVSRGNNRVYQCRRISRCHLEDRDREVGFSRRTVDSRLPTCPPITSHNKFSVLTCDETEPTVNRDIDSKKGDNESETENEATMCPTQIQILQRPKGADHSKGKGKVGSAVRPIVSREVRSAE